MIMVPIKEALTFDDVTLAPKYSEILPSQVDTSIKLTKYLNLKSHSFHQPWIRLQRAKWLLQSQNLVDWELFIET